jgi:exonuclease SbcC
MKITRVRMTNFRQHMKTELAFDGGITGIIGPNGSGKTTILEAIAWALYGNQAIRGTRDSIRFSGAGPRAAVEVELEFELAGHRYRVTRALTTAAVYLDGADTAIANSISGVNELLQRRLGMSRAEFFNTYFTGQKELSVMAAMGPTERAQFLSRVLGYERLRTAQDLLREQRRVIGAEIAGLRSGMPDADVVAKMVLDADAKLVTCIAQSNAAGTMHAAALAEVARVTPSWESIQKQREQWQRLLAEVTIAERDVATLTRETERVAADLLQIATAREELDALRQAVAPLAAYTAETRELDELFRQQGRRQTLVENERVLRDELVKLRERHARLEAAPAMEIETAALLEQQKDELERVQKAADTKRTEWVRDRQEAETKLQELRRQYADVKQQREQLQELGPDSPCPTCNRALGASFTTVIDALNEQLETLQIDGQYYRDRGEQLAAAPAELVALDERRRTLSADVAQTERKLTKIQLAVQELPTVAKEIAAKEARCEQMVRQIADIPDNYDAARHTYLREELERLAPLQSRADRLAAAVERTAAVTRDQERIVVELSAARTKLEALRAAGATTTFSEEQYTAARMAFEQAVADARATELAVVTAQGDVRSAQQSLDTAREAQQEYQRIAERYAVLQADRRMHDELDRAFTDLRTDLNFQLRPELSELASAFLTDLTDDRYSQLELDDQYNILVLEDGVAKPVISGGEEDLANLVLRLAISQMIAERAGQAFSLLVLDEVFGSLDASRRDNVIELLRRLQDRFEQVILITHIEGVRDGVDRVISVRYDEEKRASVVDAPDEPLLGGELPPVDEEVVELR